MKHYIPTLDETARAIIEDNDYSLYKRRRQLIDEYSTGTPVDEDEGDGIMVMTGYDSYGKDPDFFIVEGLPDKKFTSHMEAIEAHQYLCESTKLCPLCGTVGDKGTIVCSGCFERDMKGTTPCPVCDDEILESDESCCFTCERHVCHRCVGQTRKVPGNSVGMVSVYTFCNDCLGRDTALLRGRK